MKRIAAILVITLVVSACESAEERAEGHYQSALSLLEAGDVDRAIVELRNVFQLNADHRDARLAFANVMQDRGRVKEAYRNFLRVAEQDPDDLETRLTVAEIATINRDWEAAETHFAPIQAAGIDSPRARAVANTLAYRSALIAEDNDGKTIAATEAEALVAELPENILPRLVLVEYYVSEQRFTEALTQIDATLAIDPEAREFYDARLQILAQLQDMDGLEEQLNDMVARFPDDENLEATLLRFYLSQNRVDEAESYLAERAAASDETGPFADYMQFLVQMRGAEAAMEKVDEAIAAKPGDVTLTSMRAGLLFDLGEPEQAISELEAVLEGREPAAEDNAARIVLARLLLETGNEVGARSTVEQVLSIDPTNVEALKMNASWLIDGDQQDEAINALRLALDQAPDDPGIMTLMALAHERNGSQDLMRQMLALAVETSNNAPEESLRYSNVLVADEDFRAAEGILIDSLRLNENNVDLLAALGQVYLRSDDWPRAGQVVDTLRRIDTEESIAVANSIQVGIFAGQDRTDETVAFLEQLAVDGDQNDGAKIAIARAHLASGDREAAVRAIESALEEAPESLNLKFAAGAIYGATGDFAAAETAYEEVLAQTETAETVWLELMRVRTAMGNRDGAIETLDRALGVLPDSPNLLWAQASFLEQNGDYEEAIAVYEDLYADNSNAPVIANNLASLISTYRTDEESLARAYTVARRLRGIDFPAFQDTYGWIAFRRGELEDALEHLEPAAAGLPTDPLVQYHLAKTYLALDRKEDALRQFRRSVETAGEVDLRPQIAEARQQIVDLEAALAAE